jgi:hypothetical protein
MTGNNGRFLSATLLARVAIAVALASLFATGYPAQAQTFNVIHNFTGGDGSMDGARPEAGLTIDAAGNLYGTTLLGGSGPCNGAGSLVAVQSSS